VLLREEGSHSAVATLAMDRGELTTGFEGSDWKPYHLRGATLVAGWGREMLFSITSANVMQMKSAGRDGFFRWSPGEDRLLQTDPWGPVVGVDRDASADHVTLWKAERRRAGLTLARPG